MKKMTKDVFLPRDKLPPQNIDAEESLLASILMDNEEMVKIHGLIRKEDFYRTAHQKIFSAIVEMLEKGELVELVTLAEELRKKKILDEVGGAIYIAKLIDCAPMTPNIRSLAIILREKALKREVIKRANDLMSAAFDDAPVSELLSGISALESKIVSMVPGDEEVTKLDIDVGNFLSDGFVAETPFRSLNEIIEGIISRELLIIGGRPGMGKTALTLQLIEHLAIKQKEPVLYCGAQMSRERIKLRILAERCKVNFRQLLAGRPPKEKHALLLEDQIIVNGAGIFDFIIGEKIEIPELWAQINRLMATVDLKLIAIENLQQLDWPGMNFRNDQDRASFIAEKIRSFGIKSKIPIMVSSQINRDIEDRPDKRPMPSDIFGKKAEELSDIIIFPFRPNYYSKERNEEAGRPERNAELLVSKGGPPVVLPFTFWGDYLLWEEG